MNLKKVYQFVDYGDSESLAIKIIKGKFKGVVYRYFKVKKVYIYW